MSDRQVTPRIINSYELCQSEHQLAMTASWVSRMSPGCPRGLESQTVTQPATVTPSNRAV